MPKTQTGRTETAWKDPNISKPSWKEFHESQSRSVPGPRRLLHEGKRERPSVEVTLEDLKKGVAPGDWQEAERCLNKGEALDDLYKKTENILFHKAETSLHRTEQNLELGSPHCFFEAKRMNCRMDVKLDVARKLDHVHRYTRVHTHTCPRISIQKCLFNSMWLHFRK